MCIFKLKLMQHAFNHEKKVPSYFSPQWHRGMSHTTILLHTFMTLMQHLHFCYLEFDTINEDINYIYIYIYIYMLYFIYYYILVSISIISYIYFHMMYIIIHYTYIITYLCMYNMYDIQFELWFSNYIWKVGMSGIRTYDLQIIVHTIKPLSSLVKRWEVVNCLQDQVTTRLKPLRDDCNSRV